VFDREMNVFITNINMRDEGFTVVNMLLLVFWVVMPFGLVGRYCFRQTYWP
jgi:hypothetical protein